MKKHLLNRCQNCGRSWFPRGFDLSRKCPDCGSVDVEFTGRIYLGILAIFAALAGILWATDVPHKRHAAVAVATPASTPSFMKPRQAKHVVAETSNLPRAGITTEFEGRQEALRLYPDLGIADSPLNREFVARYHSYQRLQPDFFQDPAWPVTLAKECAAVIGGHSQAAMSNPLN